MKTAALQSLSGCFGVITGLSLQTVVCHALHVAVHTEPHVTPAAYPLAVQFNQADDMQHDIPLRSVPLTASLREGGFLVRE